MVDVVLLLFPPPPSLRIKSAMTGARPVDSRLRGNDGVGQLQDWDDAGSSLE